MSDADTRAFYAREAARYARTARSRPTPALAKFLDALPCGAMILELGCGDGGDAEAMIARGFAVTPTDGTPEMAREAEVRLGRRVAVLRFDSLDAESAYDGVWANACLLHVPRAALSAVLGRIHRALRPGGLFFASYKSGTAEGRDKLGRLYSYPDAAWLGDAYRAAGRWATLEMAARPGGGFDGVAVPWIGVTARRE